MGDLVWVRLFVPKLLKILYEFSAFVLFCSSQHYTPILFFFFSVQKFVSSKLLCRISFLF